MIQHIVEFIKNNWLPILSLVVTPIIIAIINKITIKFTSADDIIKLKEYKENKKKEKQVDNFHLKLYRICYQNQKRYKGWVLCDFNEFGDIENRWFRVRNNQGEYRTVKFPENLIVRRYGFSSNDRLDHGHYIYKPNFIENIITKLKNKQNNRIIEKNTPSLIAFLEDIKQKNETIEISEVFRRFKKIKYYTLEKMLLILMHEKQRKDLTDLIMIRQLGTNQISPYFK